MKKVLIANIFGIGDILFTTPLVANLRKAFSGVEVDYLCNARSKDVAECIPGVNKILVYEKDDFRSLWRKSKKAFLSSALGLFREIKNGKYDVVFDFTLQREFGFIFMLAGIDKRIGLDYKNRGVFLTDKLPLEGFENRHVAEHYLDLLDLVGLKPEIEEMCIYPDPVSLEWADEYLSGKGLEEKPFMAVVPGGGASWGKQASRKRWHEEGFLAVADELSEKGVNIAILGDPLEEELCTFVAGKMKKEPKIKENNLTLKEYIALLSKSALVLCNDGGPLHLAVALGVPTVSVFGPVDEEVYGPFPRSAKHKVIKVEDLACRPCYSRFKLPECDFDTRCITDIKPEEVIKSCSEVLF